MAAQAHVVASARRFTVTGVATAARCVLFHLVKAWQLRTLVTTAARRRRRDSARPVRPVAAPAVPAELPMPRLSLRSMTLGARRSCRRPGVRLVAVPARLVARRGAPLFGLVTTAARRRLSAAVRLVAADALGVALVHPRALGSVARFAPGHREQRLMGEAAVTRFTRLVTGGMGRARDLRRMARFAGAMVRLFTDEVVGRVAALALHASVKCGLLRCALVARATIGRARQLMIERGVRVVAAHAAAGHALLGVIRMLRAVATRASLLGAAAHVVRAMTARALLVRRYFGLSQNYDVFVASAARRSFGFFEVVGPMATDALLVASFEQRCRGNDGLLLGVAIRAPAQRLRCRRVLLLVARRAHLVRRLAVRRVRGGDGLVTLAARPGLRAGVGVGPVTAQAFPRGMDLDGRGLALRLQVAMRAVSRGVGVRTQLQSRRRRLERPQRQRVPEAVAQRTVARLRGPKLGQRLGAGVLDFRLLFVARGAALGADRPYFAFTDGMA